MAKYYPFATQSASDECPAVPRGVRVWGDHQEQGTKNDLGAATKVLAAALKDDPRLKLDHPEFLSPEDRKKKTNEARTDKPVAKKRRSTR